MNKGDFLTAQQKLVAMTKAYKEYDKKQKEIIKELQSENERLRSVIEDYESLPQDVLELQKQVKGLQKAINKKNYKIAMIDVSDDAKELLEALDGDDTKRIGKLVLYKRELKVYKERCRKIEIERDRALGKYYTLQKQMINR